METLRTQEGFERLRQAASRLLVEDGPEGISVRRVATAAGMTTMAIYSGYGGKQGLLEALCADGFNTLSARQRAVPETEDPVADLLRIAHAYREFGRERPGQYLLMFSQFIPSEATQMIALEGLEALSARVRRAVDAGQLNGDPEPVAHALLAFCHGALHLEALQLEPGPPESAFNAGMEALLRGFSI